MPSQLTHSGTAALAIHLYKELFTMALQGEASPEHLRELVMCDNPNWLQERIAQLDEACAECRHVFEDRAERYGDATRTTGILGAAVALVGDIARLRKLVLDPNNLSKLDVGKLRDAFIDIHNYAAIGLIWLKQDNITGQD